MTNVLTLDLLRAHDASWSIWNETPRGDPARAALRARWSVDSEGRLVCRWQAAAGDTGDPSA